MTSLFISGLAVLCLVQAAVANPELDSHVARRLRAGMDLFPSFLAADLHLKDKVDTSGQLVLYVVHHNDKRTADRVAERLQTIKKIKGMPLRIMIVRDDYEDFNRYQPSAIFIAQAGIPHLSAIVNYGKKHSIFTFSPFDGDVSQGVAGSIAITARILPQLNMDTLAASNIDLKPFFLRIASRYPETELN